MKILIKNMVIISPLLLLGCEKDESLNPSPNGEMISVIAKMPLDSEILPLEIMYRSNSCLKSRKNSNGDVVKEPGYHFVSKNFNYAAEDSEFNLTVARDGGGQCRWILSNITIGFRLKELSPNEGENIEYIPTKEIIVFDDNSPQRISGPYEIVDGNVKLENDYFPVITTRRSSKSPLEYSIVRSSSDVIYKSKSAKIVVFEPKIHFSKVLYVKEPSEQKVGKYISVLYPDGSMESSPYYPNYEKIQMLLRDKN